MIIYPPCGIFFSIERLASSSCGSCDVGPPDRASSARFATVFGKFPQNFVEPICNNENRQWHIYSTTMKYESCVATARDLGKILEKWCRTELYISLGHLVRAGTVNYTRKACWRKEASLILRSTWYLLSGNSSDTVKQYIRHVFVVYELILHQEYAKQYWAGTCRECIDTHFDTISTWFHLISAGSGWCRE